jgi:hypothetical protein
MIAPRIEILCSMCLKKQLLCNQEFFLPYWLTNDMEQKEEIFLEKLLVTQLFKEFLAFH